MSERRVSPRGRITYFSKDDPHAVYRVYDRYDRVIYIGCSHFPSSRIETHRSEARWRDEIVRWEADWFPNWRTANCPEHDAIWRHDPDHNYVGTVLNVIINRARWGPGGHESRPAVIAKARQLRAARIAAEKSSDWDTAMQANAELVDLTIRLGASVERAGLVGSDRVPALLLRGQP